MTYDQGDQRLADISRSIAGRLAEDPRLPLQSIGQGRHSVAVHLKPSAVATAEDLKREFGNMVDITLGFKSFPDGVLRIPVPEALRAKGSVPDLHATCHVDRGQVLGGDTVTGRVVMRNAGKTDIEISAAAAVGWLCLPRTLKIVGGNSGFVANAGRKFQIIPGDSDTLPFVVGTASCEPGTEYVVPAGPYEVVVSVRLQVGGRDDFHLLARDCFIEVL